MFIDNRVLVTFNTGYFFNRVFMWLRAGVNIFFQLVHDKKDRSSGKRPDVDLKI